MGDFFIKNRCFVIHCIIVFCCFFSESLKPLEQSNEVTKQPNSLIHWVTKVPSTFSFLEQYPNSWNITPIYALFRITTYSITT